ncbi:nuclear protein MDM1-like isoform X5 [Macrotis lagotis]|uniref:nuclear protein MDM1-like isoform X5 n=1 Tax=Macrotis lagotis TaxID=92651 RepID=UPI003D68DCB9
MPVRFRGLSEYQRNFLWKKSHLSDLSNSLESQKHPWSGLRSDQIGITKEPSFISKKRVPYYDPQISKYLEWKSEDASENELVVLPEPEVPKGTELQEKDGLNEGRILTREAPRVLKRVCSHSADSQVEVIDPVDDDKEEISDPTPMKENTETQKPTQGLSENVHDQCSKKENSKQRKAEMEPDDKISPHISQRKVNTEYRAKFLSPSQYLYRDGAWKQVRENTLNQGFQNTLNFLWYAEVKELREKAESYRKRILGTHFSRDHLNQILSDNNCVWDVSSVSSSEGTISNNIRALDLAGIPTGHKTLQSHDSPKKAEGPSLTTRCQKDSTEKLGVLNAPTFPVRRKLAWGEGSAGDQIHNCERRMEEEKNEKNKSDFVEEAKEIEEKDSDAKRDRIQEGETASLPSASADLSDSSSVSSGKGGRLPTPKLKELGGAPRTHHDLTTPTIGGAVLVSPSKVKSSFPEHREKKPSPDFLGETSKSNSNRKELGPRPLLTPLAAGLKTMDPLPLRDEIEVSISKPEVVPTGQKLPEHSIKVPVLGPRPLGAPSYWNPSCRIQGALRNAEFQHNGNLESPRTGHYHLPYQEINNDEDDDRMSQISARSAASSLMASQTLARAQKRKESFWGKK